MGVFSGPNVVEDSDYLYHVCTSSGTFIPNFSGTVEYLVVAGGGGGGMDMGGGGGGGGNSGNGGTVNPGDVGANAGAFGLSRNANPNGRSPGGNPPGQAGTGGARCGV